MAICRLLAIAVFVVAVLPAARGQHLRELGHFTVHHPGFLTLFDSGGDDGAGENSYTLLVSAFNPLLFTSDYVYHVPMIGSHLAALSAVHLTEVTDHVTWPNEAGHVPRNVFNKSSYVVVSGGFLVPFKNHGSVTLFDLDQSPPRAHALTNSDSDTTWFYHRVLWKDMNGDGLADAVTCRAKMHMFGSSEGQLVWFQQPQTDAMTSAWQSHVIADGPDTFFTMASLPTSEGPRDCILTSGYFSRSLNVYWTMDPQGRWEDTTQVQSRVIDNTIGAVFDVEAVDLNGDGSLDLLVTNNALKNASLFAYTVPADFRTGQYVRHVLHTGYASRSLGTGHGAPGSALTIYPSSSSSHPTSQKPLIVLSGDDAGQAFLLTPTSNDPSDWSYSQSVILDVGGGTVGEIAGADVDGDGYAELFIPAYSQGKVHVFTFKP